MSSQVAFDIEFWKRIHNFTIHQANMLFRKMYYLFTNSWYKTLY